MTHSKKDDASGEAENSGYTLSGIVVRFDDPELQAELETFLTKYERLHGPVDLTKRYTSTLPTEQQIWLRQHYPQRYFDGLPEFFKAFLRTKMRAAQQTGKLDDMPDEYVALYLSGQMGSGGPQR